MAAFPFFSFCSALLAISLGIFIQFNAKQSKPYMDEIFHVPQAQKYCHYKFQDWDPKITTLPGIYLFSFLCLRALSYFLGQELHLLCSTFLLRMTNVLFLMGNVLILRQLLICIHSHCDKKSAQEQKEVGIDFFKFSRLHCRIPVPVNAGLSTQSHPPPLSNIENWWGRNDRWCHVARQMTSFGPKMLVDSDRHI